MTNIKKGIKEKIDNGNSWYVSPQMKQIFDKSTKRSIKKRWDFIISVIETCQKKDIQLKILDAGCGDGVHLNILSKLKGLEIYGVDYNPVRVERAKMEYPQAKIFKGDLTNLYIKDKFDIVLCSQVLEHIEEDDKVLDNLYNSIRNRGILILGVPNEGCFMAQCRNRLFQPYIQKITDHVNFYKEDIIREKIRKSGFQMEKVMYDGFFFPLTIMNTFFSSFNIGFKVMNYLACLFKSQVGGYYFVCRKK
ncbi:methyltransferase domain-containing protein [candidate division WOR-3 bacterium]|nr:methyltransferase domain-containing protein [candidate division WOR-3 bacterium]